jgi:subtilase family serine protease
MKRFLAAKPAARRRPALSLERLEERQLLSTLSTANSALLPPVLPAVSSSDITILPDGGGVPSALYTPAQIRSAYGVSQITDEGKGETIAVVDAFSQPDIASDINKFSTQFGLPKMDGLSGDPTLSISTPTGQTPPGPPSNSDQDDWSIEISLDVEWAHSIAPYANIDLVECQNDSGDSLFAAEVDGQPFSSGVVYAASLPGVVVVTNSYGGSEFDGETDYDSEFTTNPHVAMTFSTGDNGAPGEYPAYSPDVVAVGGTSLETIGLKGTYGLELGWSGSGGGISQYETEPSFQSGAGLAYSNGTVDARTIPDVSMDADPNTGVYVLDSYLGGYFAVGGTSLSAPMWAGVIALGDEARGTAGSLNSTEIDEALYSAYDSSSYSTDFHDVTSGNNGHAAGVGYDLVTGIGTPKVPAIASLLGSYSTAPAVAVSNASMTVTVTQPALSRMVKSATGASSTSIGNLALSGGSVAAVTVSGNQSAKDQSPSVSDPIQNATSSDAALSVGSLTTLVTTDVVKPKKTIGLLGTD